MINRLVTKIHYFVVFYAVYTAFLMYEEHQEELERLENQIPAIERNIERRKGDLRNLERYFQDIEESRQNLERVAQEVERVQRQLPSEVSTTENMTLIRTIAESLNIQNVSLQPQAEENMGFYITHRYRLRAKGTYLQFLIFFEKLEESPRLLNVGAVSFEKSSKEQRGRYSLINGEIIIEVYRYNERHREERGV